MTRPRDTAAPDSGTRAPVFARNVGWNIAGNLGGKLLNPLFQIFIARLILPADYGAFAIAVAWLAFFEIGKDWGLTQAIVVRRGGAPEIALQFTIQFITALAFYALTLIVAPLAASLFSLPSLGIALPLVGLAAFIIAVADPLITSCLMEQRFRSLAIRQTLTPVIAGATGLLLAHAGYGVYALVIGLLLGQLAGTAALFAGFRGRLAPYFDYRLAAELVRMGKHIVLQRLFGYLVTHVDSFIVGRTLGAQALGLYRIGNLLAFMVPTATTPQVQQVVFTDLCSRPDPERIRSHYNRFAIGSGSALLAYAIAVYAAAPAIVPAILGEQWRGAVPVVQVFAAVAANGFVTPLNVDIAKILGFVGCYTYFAAVRAVVTVIALAWAAQFSMTNVVVTWVVVGLASSLANDVLFYRKQDIVRVTPTRLALIAAGWAWAGFVIFSIII